MTAARKGAIGLYIESLRLHDFRSYHQLRLAPAAGTTVFVGENGAGKTNLLEAVHLCCLGRSHRTANDREMIRAGADTCAVQVRVQRADGIDTVGVRLFGGTEKRRKILNINGKNAARTGELMGHVTCVMFSPEDIELMRGAPLGRRRFLDMLLSQCGAGYFYALQTYNSVLKQRNALLHAIARGEARQTQLDVWDEQLCQAAAPVVKARQYAVGSLCPLAREHYGHIGGRTDEVFALQYMGHLAESGDPAEDLRRLLRERRGEDLRRATTTAGPHRDDLLLTLAGQDMRAFASQGQMRTAVLALRLSEVDLLTRRQRETPLLLLDDVLSELDAGRRTRLLARISGIQTLLTCTDLSDLTGARPDAVLHVRPGEITAEDTP